MVESSGLILTLVVSFALAVFLLLDGALWLSVRLRVFAHGPQAPGWLTLTTRIASRAVGIAGILFWLATVSQGSVTYALLLGVILASAAFLLMNGPVWVATHATFGWGGPQVHPGFQAGIVWFSRIVGVGAVASVLYAACWLLLVGSP